MFIKIDEPKKPEFKLREPEKIIKIEEDTGFFGSGFDNRKFSDMVDYVKEKYDFDKLYIHSYDQYENDRDNNSYYKYTRNELLFIDEVENIDYDKQMQAYEKALKEYNDNLEKYKKDIAIYNEKLKRIEGIVKE